MEEEFEHEEDSPEPVAGPSTSKVEALVILSPIAEPLAPPKLTKKICKLIKAGVALNEKSYIRNGLKDVQSSIRKNERGLVVFAGDVTPVEIMCHLPGVCEELNIPYVYVQSRNILGSALGVKRGSLMVLVKRHKNYEDSYDKLVEKIRSLPQSWP